MLARSFLRRSILARPFSAYSNHRDTPYNNDDTPFEFTDEDYKEIETVLAKYPSNYKKSGIIPLLYIA
jgi:NADH dehydrogenase (ubiquinone) flavoprotein 2